MAVKDLKEFIFENYNKQIDFTKKDSYYLLTKMGKKVDYYLPLTY